MKTTTEYLDTAKTAINAPSDYALAKWLGVTKQAIYGYRAGRTIIDDYTALKIAEAIGVNPLEVIAAANLEREKNEKKREVWRKVYSRYTTASLMFFSVFSGAYSEEWKKTLQVIDRQQNIHYAQLGIVCGRSAAV
jgi:plasmid maintenance system antidote protein VapI